MWLWFEVEQSLKRSCVIELRIYRKEVNEMKKVLFGALAAMMILSLVACAGTGADQKVRTKCPACGYEFDAPTE